MTAKTKPNTQNTLKGNSKIQSVLSHPGYTRTSKFIKRNWWKILIILLLIVAFGLFAREYKSTKDQLNKLSDPKTSGQTEVQVITGSISQVIQLPTDETPTLATVNDITKLKGQTFFKNAQNGDKVLVYSKSGKALLYRPVENKVIAYTSINLQNSNDTAPTQTNAQPQPATTPKP